MMNMLFFVLCLVTISIGHTVNGMSSISKEDLELERQLNLLNKPPVKSIHTKLGYIVDCIDIYNQSAFDNPLLKNHKLQTKPSFKTKISETSVNISQTESTIVLEKVNCPIRTIPIRRITKDDLVHAKTLLNNYILDDKILNHNAYVYLEASDGPYHGVSEITSAYNPKVLNGQTSASVLFIRNGADRIVVGWHVYPQLNRNDASHIFSVWSSGKQTGCYNIYCSGFVQTDTSYYLGSPIKETSHENHIAELQLSLFQDPSSKNWWLKLIDKNIGYFPANLFSNLDVAKEVGSGGFTTSSPGVSSPPMGSGKLPDNNLYNACFFTQVSYRNAFGEDVTKFKPITHLVLDSPHTCYDIIYYGYNENLGTYLLFGGPGGDNCSF